MIMASNRRFKQSAPRKRWSLDEDEYEQDVAANVSFLGMSVFCSFAPVAIILMMLRTKKPQTTWFLQLGFYMTHYYQTTAQGSSLI